MHIIPSWLRIENPGFHAAHAAPWVGFTPFTGWWRFWRILCPVRWWLHPFFRVDAHKGLGSISCVGPRSLCPSASRVRTWSHVVSEADQAFGAAVHLLPLFGLYAVVASSPRSMLVTALTSCPRGLGRIHRDQSLPAHAGSFTITCLGVLLFHPGMDMERREEWAGSLPIRSNVAPGVNARPGMQLCSVLGSSMPVGRLREVYRPCGGRDHLGWRPTPSLV